MLSVSILRKVEIIFFGSSGLFYFGGLYIKILLNHQQNFLSLRIPALENYS
jgi:hypothetical protein